MSTTTITYEVQTSAGSYGRRDDGRLMTVRLTEQRGGPNYDQLLWSKVWRWAADERPTARQMEERDSAVAVCERGIKAIDAGSMTIAELVARLQRIDESGSW